MLKVRLTMGLSVLALALVSGGILLGDDKKPDPEPKAKGQLPALWKKLGLSDDQVQKVYKIETAYKTKIDALQQQIADLKAKEKAEMEEVLTDAQKTHLKELKLGEKDEPKDKPPAKDEKPKDKPGDK